MPQEPEMLDQRILAIGFREDAEQAIEQTHRERRAEGSAKETRRKGFTLAQSRYGNGGGQNYGVEEKHLKRLERCPQTEVVDVQRVAKEMEKCVPEARRG